MGTPQSTTLKKTMDREDVMKKVVFHDRGDGPPLVGHAVPTYKVDGLRDDEWQELRKGSLGCSEAAAVAGLNKYRSPLDVYMQKCGLIDGFRGSLATRMGTAMEPFIAKEFYRETGLEVHRILWNMAHPDEPRFTATLDGVCYNGKTGQWAVVELKNPGWRQKSEWVEAVETGRPRPGSTIESYFYQTIGQMSVTGLDLGYLVGLVDKSLYVVTIDRDAGLDELCSWIPMQVGAFWRNHVDRQNPPDPDHRDIRTLDILYSSPDMGLELEDADLAGQVTRLREIRAETGQLKDEADEIVAKLKGRMGDAVKLLLGEDVKPVRWSPASVTRFNSSEFKKAHPKLYGEFLSSSVSRRFTY